MTKEFWKNIAPDDWKKHKEKNRKTQTKNLRKRKNKEIVSQCIDPFHFLMKCDNLSNEKPTNCASSEFHRPQKRTMSYDIRNFLFSFPSLKSPTTTNTEFSVKDYYQKKNFSTKEDKIRDQHDRGKKRKRKRKANRQSN